MREPHGMKEAPLRIAHLNTEHTWRGGEQQVLSLATRLARRGHDNIIVARKASPLAKRSREAGIETREISPLGELDFFSAWRLSRFLVERNIGIIHAHAPHATALAAFCAVFSGLPALTTRRVDFPLRRNAFTRWKYARMSRVVAISEAIKKILGEDGVPPEKVLLVRSGIDFERLDRVPRTERSDLGIPDDAVLVGQVAALAPHKDQATFLRAISLLKGRIPGLRVAMVGEGSLEDQLRSLARQLGIDDLVTFYGFRNDALGICKAFDYFCLSSQTEGLGTALIDAMAMRIPVIATAAGGIPELVVNRRTGYLAQVRDPASLAAAILEAVGDHDQRATIVENAHRKALGFNIDSTVTGMEAVYREITGSRESFQR